MSEYADLPPEPEFQAPVDDAGMNEGGGYDDGYDLFDPTVGLVQEFTEVSEEMLEGRLPPDPFLNQVAERGDLGKDERLTAVHEQLLEQGLTLDTGRAPVTFGVSEFKAYYPSPEEAELGRHVLATVVSAVNEKYGRFIRKERVVVNGEEHITPVLDLVHRSEEGAIHFRITPDGISTSLKSEGASAKVSYNRYHLQKGTLADAPEDSYVRRDTTDMGLLMSDVPAYGSVPTTEIWEQQLERHRALDDYLDQQRMQGTNDLLVSFAELEYMCEKLADAQPESSHFELVDISQQRNKSENEPSSAEAYEAGLAFTSNVDNYLQHKKITPTGSYERVNSNTTLTSKSGTETLYIDVGKDWNTGDNSVGYGPFVSLEMTRTLLGKELSGVLELIKRSKPELQAASLTANHRLTYIVDPDTYEMRTITQSVFVDEAGEEHLFMYNRKKADAWEEGKLRQFLDDPGTI